MTTNSPSGRARLGFDPAYLPEFQNKTFIEGPLTARRYFNFFMLLGLATVIATYALLGASTASVIGAMIVAPLMGPIMATTAAVVMGSMHRAVRGLGLTVAGILFVIAFSFLLAGIMPDIAVSFEQNPELASRINPGLLALLTALGSGAAGAFIVSRAEIADSIGGVAIAISLVPPLCVVGIALEQRNVPAAEGALVLFLTNFLAILLAGGITFWLLGLWRTAPDRGQKRVRQTGLILFVVGILLVTIPLTFTSFQSLNQLIEDNNAYDQTRLWLQNAPGYDLLGVDVTEKGVEVTVEGNGALPETMPLANALASALKRPVTVIIRTVPAEVVQSGNP